ncbi:MAG: hypothetical protein HY433_02740 [Candidatus Liptonbacteria bacterium]|nr:hypothetical protein [Candidatus Liptonbacteria bacterium]
MTWCLITAVAMVAVAILGSANSAHGVEPAAALFRGMDFQEVTICNLEGKKVACALWTVPDRDEELNYIILFSADGAKAVEIIRKDLKTGMLETVWKKPPQRERHYPQQK